MMLVSANYVRYVHGSISVDEAHRLCKKFNAEYRIFRDKNCIYRDKKLGVCSTKMVMYYDRHDDVVHWWLLSTRGKGFDFIYPKIRNATDRHQRLRISAPKKYFHSPGQYELVRISRAKTDLGMEGKTRWSWRFTQEYKERLVNEIEHSISRRNVKRLAWQIDSLRRTPGFSIARREGFELYHRAKKKWNSTHSRDSSRPVEWPLEDIYIGWIGRVPNYQKYLYTHTYFINQTNRGG